MNLKRYLALGAVLLVTIMSQNGVKAAAVEFTPYAKIEEVGHQFNETLAAYSRMFWAFAKAFTPLPLCPLSLPIEFGCDMVGPLEIILEDLLKNSSIPLTGKVLIYPRTVNLTFDDKKFLTYGSILYDPNDNEKNPLKFNWGWTIPWVGVEMHYELKDVKAFGVLPLTGSGPLKVGIENIEAYHSGTMLLNRAPAFSILPFAFLSDWNIERISLSIVGLLGLGDDLLESISTLIGNLLFNELSTRIRTLLKTAMAAYELLPFNGFNFQINRMIKAYGITEDMVRELIGKPKPPPQ